MAARTALVVTAAPLLILAHIQWLEGVQATVPVPYLDEFFHIPQADTFWQGRWSHWDDKITTPPGVYLWSIFVARVVGLDPRTTGHLSPQQLRYTNFVTPYLLLSCVMIWQGLYRRDSSQRFSSPLELSILTFPLLFFFSGLYYTDVFSTLAVMCTYTFWQGGLARERGLQKFVFQTCHLLSGLLSLGCRQTNIFWAAVFTGGLQAVHTIKQKAQVVDPPVEEAHFEGTSIALCTSHVVSDLNVRLLHNDMVIGNFGLWCDS